MSPPSQGKPLPFANMFAASAVAACTAEVNPATWFIIGYMP
jgi:hypothetical protein